MNKFSQTLYSLVAPSPQSPSTTRQRVNLPSFLTTPLSICTRSPKNHTALPGLRRPTQALYIISIPTAINYSARCKIRANSVDALRRHCTRPTRAVSGLNRQEPHRHGTGICSIYQHQDINPILWRHDALTDPRRRRLKKMVTMSIPHHLPARSRS